MGAGGSSVEKKNDAGWVEGRFDCPTEQGKNKLFPIFLRKKEQKNMLDFNVHGYPECSPFRIAKKKGSISTSFLKNKRG